MRARQPDGFATDRATRPRRKSGASQRRIEACHQRHLARWPVPNAGTCSDHALVQTEPQHLVTKRMHSPAAPSPEPAGFHGLGKLRPSRSERQHSGQPHQRLAVGAEMTKVQLFTVIFKRFNLFQIIRARCNFYFHSKRCDSRAEFSYSRARVDSKNRYSTAPFVVIEALRTSAETGPRQSQGLQPWPSLDPGGEMEVHQSHRGICWLF